MRAIKPHLLPALRRLAVVGAVSLLTGLGPPRCLADGQAVSADALKAVLLYKLPQFVYLPDTQKSAPPVICALGDQPIDDLIEKLAQNGSGGRPARFRKIDSAVEGRDCDFVFITRNAGIDIEPLLRRVSSRGTVTVSDIPGFAKSGGMVEFASNAQQPGIQIVINRKAAQNQGIEFNAQLLRLARIVEQ